MYTSYCLLLTLLLGGVQTLTADILYSVTDLGRASYGYALNNAGQVTGYFSVPSGPYHTFLYSNGQTTDLGTLGGVNSYGYGVSNLGQVTGSSEISPDSRTTTHAFVYSNGQLTDLGTLGGRSSSGRGINNIGQVTGQAATSNGDAHAFLYSDGQMQDLGTLGGRTSMGYAINAAGQVGGNAATLPGLVGPDHAFLYSNGQMQDLGTLGRSSDTSYAYALNDAGQVTGIADTATGFKHAFLYTGGRMQDLGTLGGPDSEGRSINNLGQIVGTADMKSTSVGISRAFLYTEGQMQDLNNLIDPTLGITLTDAQSINDSGQIVASGGLAGVIPASHSYLLTPVPEPGTGALLGLSCLALGIGLWRYRVTAERTSTAKLFTPSAHVRPAIRQASKL